MRILVINRWDDGFARYPEAIDHAEHQVAYVTVPGHHPLVAASAVHTVMLDSFTDTAAVLAAAQICHSALGGVDRVISLSEHDQLTGAALRARWQVPGNDVATLTAFRDRLTAKAVVHDAGLPVPRFEAVTTAADVDAFAARCAAEVMVKPRDRAGSASCYRVRHGQAASEVLADADLTGYEVEESVPAPVWHLDGLLDNGRLRVAYASKAINSLFDVANGLPAGSVVQHGLLADRMSAFAVHCLRALGLQTGAFHVEACQTPTGPVFLAAGARVADHPVPLLIREVYGVDLVADSIRLELGERPRTAPGRYRQVAAGHLQLPRPSRQRLVDRTTSLVGLVPGLYAEELPEIGHVFGDVPHHDADLGSFRYRGPTGPFIERAIRTTLTRYQYALEPATGLAGAAPMGTAS